MSSNGTGSLDINVPSSVSIAALIPPTGTSGSGLVWIDENGRGLGSASYSIPANGRFIVAAHIVDGESVNVWFQGTKISSTSTVSSLEGGFVSALGARLLPDATLGNFCGCALHECTFRPCSHALAHCTFLA